MTKQRRLMSIDDLEPGDHLCCLYETEEEHQALITSFLLQGLERGQRVVYIADARSADVVLGYLREAGVEAEPYLSRGQLRIITADDAYMREGVFEPDGMIALLREETERALKDSYTALRVTGEMTWALRGLPGSERIVEYETKLNEFFPGSRCLAICQYDRRRFGPELLLDLLGVHPIAAVGTEVYDNFLHVPPAALLGREPAAALLGHRIDALAEQKRLQERTARLTGMLRAIRLVNQLIGRERDRGKLLKRICALLEEALDVKAAWVLLGEKKAGAWSVGGVYPEMLRRALEGECEEGRPPICVRNAMEGQEPVLIYDDVAQQSECKLAGMLGQISALVGRLEYGGKVFGALGMYIPPELAHDEEELGLFREVCGDIAFALHDLELEEARTRAEEAVRKRLAELSCLYDVAVMLAEERPLPEVLSAVAQRLPSAWQYREVCAAEVLLDDERYSSGGFAPAVHTQSSPIVIDGKPRGEVRVCYVEERPQADEGPFLKEERYVLDAVAEHLRNYVVMLEAARERDEAHTALQLSEELYRGLVESVACEVVRIDREGRRTFVGGTTLEMHGATPEELQRGTFADRMLPEDRNRAWAMLRETFETGRGVRGLVTRQRAGDAVRYIQVNWEPIKDAEGNVVEVQATNFDVTDRVEAERRRLEAERLEALANMAGGIAHDINNVLAMVIMWAEIARTKARDPAVMEALGNVIQAATDGAETMRRLRRFTQPRTAGRLERVDLREIVDECIEFTKPMWKDEAEAKDIYIGLMPELDEVPELAGNPSELREVVVNLIRNAVEAMPEGGTLTVRTYSEGDRAFIEVSDTGIGIPEENLTRIFDPFFTTKGREGSGLGLSTVRNIVTAHGGKVDVRSVEGEGSTFVVSLPLQPPQQADEVRGAAPMRGEGTRGRPCSILAVDDEPLVRNAMKAVLEREGHRVVIAEDGATALSAFERRDFDVVLLDLGLPEMNGYRVAEEMRRLKPAIPIVVVTGWGEDVDRERLATLGIQNIIVKPFQADELVRAIQEVRGEE